MDYLWTPWRYAYITGEKQRTRKGVPEELAGWPGEDQGCVFCNMIGAVEWAIGGGMPAEDAERAAGVVMRRPGWFVCLNAYPYSTGHVMVLPYQHVDSLLKLPEPTATDLMAGAREMEGYLREVYRPDGLNLGMNLGKAAGAGVADHLHLHVLPRWAGDTNFMTATAETRVLPETLDETWKKLREVVHKSATLTQMFSSEGKRKS